MSIERHPLFIRPKLELCREIERLRAELSECKRDAERYHWIKQCALFGITKRQDIVLTLPIYAANHIGELDAGIDASRKGEGG